MLRVKTPNGAAPTARFGSRITRGRGPGSTIGLAGRAPQEARTMPVEPPFSGLRELMTLVGQAGRRLAEIDASEGAAGNISLYAAWPLAPEAVFPNVETLPLPEPALELAGGGLLVTGSGRRLRE